MSLSLIINYKNGESLIHPFSFQSVLHERWWPLAEQLNLPTLQRLEILRITDSEEAERFVAELRIIEQYLKRPGNADDYMLTRISELLPIMERAIAEWGQVAAVSV